nr:signal peptide peptidase SppA [Motiliproteus sp. SC1-56]
MIEKLVMGLGAEQRRARRWGIFFKSLTFIYLFAALFLLVPGSLFDKVEPHGDGHTALVEVQGTIAQDEDASADRISGALRRAFKDEGTRGVIVRINSPGGSPVQAGYVYDEIRRLKAEYPQVPVYSVIADIGASGGYYIAAAADEIYADKASLVGSIGVVSSSFGFVDMLEKLGVERRLMTAGEHKAFLDPFVPLKASEKEFWSSVLETTHAQFIEQVKRGRGERLKDDAELFSGLVWTGEQALELGLVDGLGSAGYVAREVVGAEEIVNFTPAKSTLERLTEQLGVSIARTLSMELGLGGSVLR